MLLVKIEEALGMRVLLRVTEVDGVYEYIRALRQTMAFLPVEIWKETGIIWENR